MRPASGGHRGYEHRGEAGVPGRLFFREFRAGRRAYHLHVAEVGSEFWDEHLVFRDYLRAHPENSREYARMKHESTGRAGVIGRSTPPRRGDS